MELKKYVSLFAALLILLSAVPAQALAASGSNSSDLFSYTVSNGEATIKKYNGSGGDVVIPSEIGGCPVTVIGKNAFLECGGLTSVTIPDGVTVIGEFVFYKCSSLVSAAIPASVTGIEKAAFYGCSALNVVRFSGTFNQWTGIVVGDYNEPLRNAEIITADSGTGGDYPPVEGYTDAELAAYPLGVVRKVGSFRSMNWAGISTVSQFADEQGNLCLAVEDENQVLVYKIREGGIRETVAIPKPDPEMYFGTALCDEDGYLYLVFGRNNESDDTSVNTVFINKYTGTGQMVASVGSCGDETATDAEFHTQYPFASGNCDAAISGDVLAVSYARTMYNGHQSNTVFAINKSTMEKKLGLYDYNSHSFDQRVTPYAKTNGFLFESHGDCYDRCFSTSLTNANGVLNKTNTFDFWVERGTYSDFDMRKLNRTRARLGNILETDTGAALVASSAHSLSADCKSEPWDVFVQIFNPMKSGGYASSYVTEGSRAGLAGKNGDEETVNYGVKWLTDNSGSGYCADVVQAVSLAPDCFAVLYELYRKTDSLYVEGNWNMEYVSTWFMVVDSHGNIVREAEKLDGVRLNADEDPLCIDGTVQWVSNDEKTGEMVLYKLSFEPSEGTDLPAQGVLGDVNMDGTVNSKDYLILKRSVLQTYTLSEEQKRYADLNRDGKIDAKDYLLLKRVVLGTYVLPQ